MLKNIAICGLFVQFILIGLAAYLYKFEPVQFSYFYCFLCIVAAFIVLFMSISIIYEWNDNESKQS